MRINGIIFGIIAVFLAIVDVIYASVTSRSAHGLEATGVTVLAFGVGLAGLVSVYLLYTSRRIGYQPEDSAAAEIAEGAGELGFYSAQSIWPIIGAVSAGIAILGLIFGWWLFFIGVAFGVGSAVGFVFEYYQPSKDPDILALKARDAEAAGHAHH